MSIDFGGRTVVETLPRIWFERALDLDMEPEVAAAATILVPTQPMENPLGELDAAEGALAGVLTYDGALMDRAPHLKVICRTGIGSTRSTSRRLRSEVSRSVIRPTARPSRPPSRRWR